MPQHHSPLDLLQFFVTFYTFSHLIQKCIYYTLWCVHFLRLWRYRGVLEVCGCVCARWWPMLASSALCRRSRNGSKSARQAKRRKRRPNRGWIQSDVPCFEAKNIISNQWRRNGATPQLILTTTFYKLISGRFTSENIKIRINFY